MVNSFSTTNGLSKLVAQGQINLVQKENFALGRIERVIGFGPENDLAYMIKRSKILSVFDKKWGSNTTADYEVEATYVTSSSRSGAEEVQISLIMDVPLLQEFRYTPSFLENLTLGWCQYLAILIPSLAIIYELILGGAFKRKILNSKIWSEIKKAQPSGFHNKPERYDF